MVKHATHREGCLAPFGRQEQARQLVLGPPLALLFYSAPPTAHPLPGLPGSAPTLERALSLSPVQIPMVNALGPPLCSIIPSLTSWAVSCLCLCVGTPVPSPCSRKLGNLWEGTGWWGEDQILKSSGLPPLTPSFLGLSGPCSSQFLKVLSCLLVDSLICQL